MAAMASVDNVISALPFESRGRVKCDAYLDHELLIDRLIPHVCPLRLVLPGRGFLLR